jgi:hypothetical protein
VIAQPVTAMKEDEEEERESEREREKGALKP